MPRLALLLLVAAGLAGCSVQDVRRAAESVRVRAEGIGAQAEAERSDQLLVDNSGGTAYREGQVEESLQPQDTTEPADTGAAAASGSAAPPRAPQQPVYVIVPAN